MNESRERDKRLTIKLVKTEIDLIGKRSNLKYFCPHCGSFLQDDNTYPKIVSQAQHTKSGLMICPYCRNEVATKSPPSEA